MTESERRERARGTKENRRSLEEGKRRISGKGRERKKTE